MAGRNSNPPLFELIRQEKPRVRSGPPQPAGPHQGAALAEPPALAEPKPPKAVPREAAPAPVPDEPALVSARAVEQIEPRLPLRERLPKFKLPRMPSIPALPPLPDFQIPSRISDLKQSITMPVSRLWIGGALGAAALIAVVWISVTWAFQAGKTSQDLSPYLTEGPILTDPLAEPDALSRTPPESGTGVPVGLAGVSTLGSSPTPSPPAPRFPEDTREVGLNYLQLTSFVSRDEAFKAAAFLTEAGVPTIPVGMDTGRVDGNNREKYLLIALEGIPGDRFRALADRRAQIRRRVQELGRIWTKEHGGTHAFHDPQWAKHK